MLKYDKPHLMLQERQIIQKGIESRSSKVAIAQTIGNQGIYYLLNIIYFFANIVAKIKWYKNSQKILKIRRKKQIKVLYFY